LGSKPCTSATASATPVSPQAPGTAVAITAAALGCPNPNPLYQFWILTPGGAWSVVQAYSTIAAFNWNTTGKVSGTYRFSVWVRDAGSVGTSSNSLGCNDAFVPVFADTPTSNACPTATATRPTAA